MSMRRVALVSTVMAPVVRLVAVLSLALCMAGAGSFSARAQDEQPADVTPEVTEEAPPEQAEVLQGTLTISVYTCASDPGGGGAVFLAAEFAPAETCTEEGTASVSIDGNAAEAVTSGAQYALDEGVHNVVETTLGFGIDVTVDDEAPAGVAVVFYTTPVEGGGDVATGTIAVMKHVCPAEVQTQEQFDALGGFVEKTVACPVITLPGNAGPDGAINGNDPDNPLSFDFQVATGDTVNGIDTAVFMSAQLCEIDAGDLNGNPDDAVCLDTSHYAYEGVAQGAVTVTESTAPEGYRFGALELTPDSGDDAALTNVTPETGTIELDTTGDESVMLHIYNFQEPVENRVNIVKHECPDEIESNDDFDGIGEFTDKIQTCPVVLLGSDAGPDGAVSGGNGRTFDFDVEGSDGGIQTLADATFVPDQLCESELGQDINGDAGDDLCLDNSRYQLDGVAQGPGVLVTEIEAPLGYAYGALEFDPARADDAALVDASDDGVIELDTTLDGEVTLHVFNFAAPEEEPSPYGSVQVVMLFCFGPVEETLINVLAPGQDATAADMGDASCVAGDSDFMISLNGSDELAPFSVGNDGVETIFDLSVTDGSGLHVLTELYTLASADFVVEPDTVTRLIVLNYYPQEIVGAGGVVGGEEAYVEPYYDDWTDEDTIDSGEDLANTGAGANSLSGPLGGSAALLIGATSLLLLAGAALRRRHLLRP